MTGTYRQFVPRPKGAERSDPAPWTVLSAEERKSVPLSRVRAAFAGALAVPVSEVPVTAAVLVAFQERDGEATVVLIRRADDMVSDSGHIAFPGGYVEAGEDPITTALRESEEEVGLDPGLVEVIGTLPAAGRRQHPVWVLPVLGVVSERPVLVPNAAEVAAIFEVPLAALAANGVSWQERWAGEGPESEMTFFAGLPGLTDDLIWGLSARVLAVVLSTVFASQVAASE